MLKEFDNFKKDITEVMNKYVNEIPAIFLAQHLEKIVMQLNEVAKEQLETELIESQEKKVEVNDNGNN